MMEIQVPEGVDILAFVAANLTTLHAMLGGLGAWAVHRAASRAFEQSMVFHVAQDRGVRRSGSQGGIIFGQNRQIIGVKLVTPAGVLAVLSQK